MQRILITLLLVMASCVFIKAGNTIALSSVQGHPGDEVQVSVSLSGDEMPTAIELFIPLDNTIKYVDGSAVLNSERSNGHSLAGAVKDGMLSIVIFSPTLAPINGYEGELCSFKLKLGKEPADYVLTPQVVMSNASGTSVPVTTEGGIVKLLSPKIEVVASKIDFGHIPIRSVYTKNLTLRNVGNETLEVTQVVSGRDDLVAKTQSYSIAPGSTQNVVLTYSPMVRGAIESQIKIESNAVNPKAGVATVVADPFSVNELHVQKTEGIANEEVEVVLNMDNMEPISGAQCEFVLPAELVYVEGSAKTGSRCEGKNHTATGIVQGNRLTLLLYSASNATLPEGDGELMTFRLRLKGYSGSYRLNPESVVLSNASMENMTSATTGNTVTIKSPKLNANSSLNFSEVPVAQESEVTYTISNNGNQPLVVSKVAFLSEGYSVKESLPVTIASYGRTTLTIRTTPASEGDFKTTMQVYSNDPKNSMHSVAVSGKAYESNSFSVEGRNTEKGYRFKFSLDNYSDVVAIQMNLKWKSDMKTFADMLKPTERLDNHYCMLTDVGGGNYQILIYSMSNAQIVGHEGELFSIDYIAEDGAEFINTTLTVENIVLSNSNGDNKARTAEFNVTALNTFTLGDVNNDDQVNITDAIGVVNHILGKSMILINLDAADANQDGVVNITDAIAITNLILNQNSK